MKPMRVFPFFLLLLLNGNLRAQVPPTVDPVEFCTEYEYLFRKQVSRFYPLPDSLIALFENDWDWRGLSANTDLEWTPEFIARYADKWVWHELLMNPSIVWTETLIETYREHHEFNWYYLSRNPTLPLTAAFLDRYAEKLNWSCICENPTFKRQKNLVRQYKKRCAVLPPSEPYKQPPADLIDTYLRYGDAWKKRSMFIQPSDTVPAELYLIRSRSIHSLDFSLLKKYPNAWNWHMLDRCKLLPWSLELLREYNSPDGLVGLGANEGIYETTFSPFLSNEFISAVLQQLSPPEITSFYILQESTDEFGLIPGVTTSKGYQEPFFDSNLLYNKLSDSMPPVDFILGGIYEPPLRFADLHDWGHSRPFRSAAITVSPKMKAVLEKFKLPPHRFYPISLSLEDKRYGRGARQYYVFHIAECDYQYLDYAQVQFHWSQRRYKPGRRQMDIGAPLEQQLTSEQDYLELRDSIIKAGPPFPNFQPREYIWDADFDVMACEAEEPLTPIWVSEDVKKALEQAGVTGIKFEKVRAARPRMLGTETPEHRLRNADILAAIKLDYATRPPEPEQRSVVNYRKDCRWRDSVLAQKGIVRQLRKNQPLPETTDPVERKLREKELAWDVVLPDAYRKAVALMKFPRHKLPFLHYEFYHIDRVEQVGDEWHKNYPFTVRAVLIAWNGVGDYLGFLLKPGSTYELDDTVYEFLHETGEVKPVGKL
ncbi:MAG: SMI1/KNR4 family protein [Lewinellaceae bacterium]|nr:SMI1/KNR4 family protein [Lewinellaceae bacterium]